MVFFFKDRETKSIFVCLFGFLTSLSTTRLYRGRAPRQSVWQFYVLPHMRQSCGTMTSVSAGHIILTPTQPVGSGRPQGESNPGPPDQESRALPTELPRPPPPPPSSQSTWGKPVYNWEPKTQSILESLTKNQAKLLFSISAIRYRIATIGSPLPWNWYLKFKIKKGSTRCWSPKFTWVFKDHFKGVLTSQQECISQPTRK